MNQDQSLNEFDLPLIHPVQRAIERGITHPYPLTVIRAVEAAVNEKIDDLVERVMTLPDGKVIWRFRMENDGLFYAICTGQRPVVVLTVITQEMLRAYRRRRKMLKRTRSATWDI